MSPIVNANSMSVFYVQKCFYCGTAETHPKYSKLFHSKCLTFQVGEGRVISLYISLIGTHTYLLKYIIVLMWYPQTNQCIQLSNLVDQRNLKIYNKTKRKVLLSNVLFPVIIMESCSSLWSILNCQNIFRNHAKHYCISVYLAVYGCSGSPTRYQSYNKMHTSIG